MTHETDNHQKIRAVLVGLQVTNGKRADEDHFERSMKELAELTRACDVEEVATVTQRLEAPVQATYVGPGKVEEIKAAMYMFDATLVIFDQSLSPTQIRNLAGLIDAEVIDRTDLILRIFSDRARTREARLQVEYARLEYMLPRLVGMRNNLSRQGGNTGFRSSRGAGETKLELDRRKIVARQAALRRELKEVEKERQTQGVKRKETDALRVGLVGYTNAGKSSLMNKLLSMSSARGKKEKEVFVKDMLFATLDTTIRRIEIYPHKPFLLSDTVGFIDDLPTPLVKAFRSTLAEAASADLLLMVIDVTDPDYREQMAVTQRTLAEIGAGHIPLIRVYNKCDKMQAENMQGASDHQDAEKTEAANKEQVQNTDIPQRQDSRRSIGWGIKEEGRQIRISAKTGEGLSELLDLLDRA